MNHTKIGIITLAAVAVMLIAATNLIPIIQQQVYARSQRSTQSNLCSKSEECNNSNVSNQLSGNDNKAIGFADQSHRSQCCNVQPLNIIVVPRP